MNICLIRPPTVLRLLSITIKPSPPLGLAYIASSLSVAGHKVTIIDAIAEKPDQFDVFHDDIVTNGLTNEEILKRIPSETDVIGITIMFTNNWLNDRQLINFLGERLPHVTLIAGGEHVTGMPEICLSQATGLTACVLGEGEETVVELIDAIQSGTSLKNVQGIAYRQNNEVIINGRRKRVREIENIAWPEWDIFPLKAYMDYGLSYGVVQDSLSLPILATRGCPYECTFCSSPQMWGTRYYMRSPANVADEMEHYQKKYGATNFDFYDLTAIINKRWIIDFAQEVISRKLNITWQIPAGTRCEVIDREVAYYLYASGCRNITYAPESGSEDILKKIKKKVVLDNMLKSIYYSHQEHMNIKLNMIIGFPEEKHKHILQTIKFLIRASWYGVNDIFPTVLVPYVGCELFEQLKREGKINPNDDNYYYNIISSEAFFGSHFYNENMSQTSIRVYRIFYLLVFYFSNFLFRPQRFFRTIRNLLTKRFESRGEIRLYEIIQRGFFQKKVKKYVR